MHVKENDFKVCSLCFGSRKSRIVNMSSSESVSNGFCCEIFCFFMVEDFVLCCTLFCDFVMVVGVVFLKYNGYGWLVNVGRCGFC